MEPPPVRLVDLLVLRQPSAVQATFCFAVDILALHQQTLSN